MSNVTAYEIKEALSKKHGKDFFITECKSGSTWMTRAGEMKILDGLAIRKSWTSPCFTGYEVKVSRSDFLRDAKFYTYEELVNCLYIACPKGMIDRTELPESVGLIYYDQQKNTLSTRKKAIYRKIEYSPDMLLYILYTRLDNDRIPFYSDKREYFEAYLKDKGTRRALGKAVGSKLITENIDLARQITELERFKQHYDDYKAIGEVLHNHHIWGFRGKSISEELDEALVRKCPDDISDLRKSLEIILARVQRMESAHERTKIEQEDEQ